MNKTKTVHHKNLHKKPKKELVVLHPYDHSKLTFGQKMADLITKWAGSWHFIVAFLVLLATWISLNIWLAINAIAFDEYPFILLNLALSMIAAIQAPVILMSQNRAMERDRINMERDHYINRRAEREVAAMQEELAAIKNYLYKMNHKKK
jgi:uncharacterized membrane protein